MRILHVAPTYFPAVRYGGPIQSVRGLCKALAQRGHDVHVCTTNVDGGSVSDVPVGQPVDLDGVTVRYFPTGIGRRLFRSPDLAAYLDTGVAQFDVVHLHTVFNWPTTVAARLARRDRVPYVVSPRGMLVRKLIRQKSRLVKSAWIGLFERSNLAAARSVVVTADIEAQDIVDLGLAAARFDVIPNGVDAPPDEGAAFDGELDRLSGPVILCLGRVHWKKGIDRLIASLASVPEARLVVAGNDEDGYTEELKAVAARIGVAERVHFVGPAYGARKWALFRRADVFALASHSENFGVAVLEAMACGCPVVVTPDVGLADAVAGAGAGLVAAGEPAVFGAALARLIRDPALRRQAGEAGKRLAEDRFSWSAIAERTERLYAEFAATASPADRPGSSRDAPALGSGAA